MISVVNTPAGFDLRKPTILIIDDDPNNLAIVMDYLEDRAYTILVAEDGESGLTRAGYVRPDLILLDIMMPGMDGYETCRRLKALESTREIPVIFMTALAETVHKIKGFEAGAVDYITKPFQREEVLARVGVHLRLRELATRLQEANEFLEKRVEERTTELRNSERKLADIINMLPDATFVTDLDGRITLWNRTAEEFTGVKAEEMMGKGDHEYSIPFYGDRRPILIDLVLDPSADIANLYPFVKKEGEMVIGESYTRSVKHGEAYMLGIAAPLYDSEGNMSGAIESVRDISERKRAEDEFVRLATAIEQAAEAIFITDAHWNIHYVNPAFERMNGYSRDEIIGQHTRILKSDKHDRKLYRNIRQTLTQGKVWSGRLTNSKKDGTTYEAEVTASPVRDKKGVIINYVSIHRDITHEIKLERDLRQSQKMEAIGTLAGGIAHDFNNILTAIIGFTQMALYKIPQGNPARSNLERVLESGFRATDLVRQILSFSRKNEQERKPVALAPIVKEVLKLLRSSLPSTIEIRQGIGIIHGKDIVFADPTQIHQVLMNLCTNAAHAMQVRGGVLSVDLSDVAADESLAFRYPDLKPGPYVRLTVSDSGHGMDAAVIERIYDPYFTTKGPGEGTGLGLAVVQGIVKNHGGAIIVYSEPGQGTTFQVYLHRIEGEIALKAEHTEPLPTGNERILFIDDENSLALLGQEMLESLGYDVTTKTSSIEALQTFRSRSDAFDLIITDMTMPELTGKELAKAFMAIRPDIPIILCTGFSELINGRMAKECGIREFIMKPYVAGNLAITIRKVLDGINQTEYSGL